MTKEEAEVCSLYVSYRLFYCFIGGFLVTSNVLRFGLSSLLIFVYLQASVFIDTNM